MSDITTPVDKTRARARAQADADAVAAGISEDPFAVLGCHRDSGPDAEYVVRTIQPAAERVELLVNGQVMPMVRLHADGLFEARWPESAGGAKDYRLRVHVDGAAHDIDDPYRFGQILSDY